MNDELAQRRARLRAEALKQLFEATKAASGRKSTPQYKFADTVCDLDGSTFSNVIAGRTPVPDHNWNIACERQPQLVELYKRLVRESGYVELLKEIDPSFVPPLQFEACYREAGAAFAVANAGEHLLVELRKKTSLVTGDLVQTQRNVTCWLVQAIQQMLRAGGNATQFIVCAVGERVSASGADPHAFPLLWAATGATAEPLDGRDKDELAQFTIDDRFPLHPAPPSGERTQASGGLVLRAWQRPDRMDTVPHEKLDDGTGACACYPVGIAGRESWRGDYLEFSKQTQVVYIFRVVAETGLRLVIAVDILDECRLAPDERAWVFKLMLASLNRVGGGVVAR